MMIFERFPRLLRSIVLVVCCLILALPVAQALAQTNGTQQEDPSFLEIKTQAEQDAKQDVSGFGYGVGGFFCGIFGWLFATLSNADAPASRLIGKSPTYVSIYVESYKSKAKSIKTTAACIGWGIGTVASIAIIAASGGFEKKTTTY